MLSKITNSNTHKFTSMNAHILMYACMHTQTLRYTYTYTHSQTHVCSRKSCTIGSINFATYTHAHVQSCALSAWTHFFLTKCIKCDNCYDEY